MKILNKYEKTKFCQAQDVIGAEVGIGIHNMEI